MSAVRKPDAMCALSSNTAAKIVASLELEPANRAVADVWLSLWDAGALPSRDRLSPFKFKAFLPGILVFDVVPDHSVTIRLAGTRFSTILGTELTGMDWIASAPADYRAQRLKIISEIARGGIGVGHRRIGMTLGESYICEEIMLPFAPAQAGAPFQVLTHVNWQADKFLQIKSARQATGTPLDFKVYPFA